MIKRYRRDSKIFEAVQWTGENYDEIMGMVGCYEFRVLSHRVLYVRTSAMPLIVGMDEWVVKAGARLSVFSSEDFEEYYKPIEDTDPDVWKISAGSTMSLGMSGVIIKNCGIDTIFVKFEHPLHRVNVSSIVPYSTQKLIEQRNMMLVMLKRFVGWIRGNSTIDYRGIVLEAETLINEIERES